MADDKAKQNEITEEQYAGMVFEDGGSMVVDMSAVEEAKFEIIPRGTYQAEVDELTFGLSQASGSPMWTARMNIVEGEYAGRKLTWYASFSRKALPFTKANLNRLAPEIIAQGAFNPQQIADSGQLLGRRIGIRVGTQKGDDGIERNQISALVPAATEGGGSGFFGSKVA
jgi:hypothetical protein